MQNRLVLSIQIWTNNPNNKLLQIRQAPQDDPQFQYYIYMLNTPVRPYKHIRTHKLSKNKIRQLLPGQLPPIKINNASNIQTLAVVDKSTKKLFNIDHDSNSVYMYDHNTYAEVQVDCVLPINDKQAIFKRLTLLPNNNYVLLYCEGSQDDKKILVDQGLPKNQTNQTGLIERAIQALSSKINKQEGQELLISVIAFTHNDIMIDLLNSQTDTKLKLNKEGNRINVQNLTQMAIENVETFMETLPVRQHIKFLSETEQMLQIEAEVYQLSIAKLSQEKNLIELIRNKFNLVKVKKSDRGAKSYLGHCLKNIIMSQKFVPTRNSKLTHFLEDCLNMQSNIQVIFEIDNSKPIKSQIQNLALQDYIGKKVLIRKNYIGDQDIIKKIKGRGTENTLVLNMAQFENQQIVLKNLRKQKHLDDRYTTSRVNRSLLSQTYSSLNKRRQVEDEEQTQFIELSKLYKKSSNREIQMRLNQVRNLYRNA